MSILPGKTLFSPESPKIPPPPPPVKSEDVEMQARRKAEMDQKRRAGRASTIITGGQGVLGDAQVSQPRAGAMLGG